MESLDRETIRHGAVKLADLGFKVFPVLVTYNEQRNKWEKRPALNNGFKGATDNASTVPYMFMPHPDAWLGIVHNDMTVVDADGAEGVETLNKVLPLLPEASVVVRTVSGGIHYYVAGQTDLESRSPRLLPGLDLLTGNDKGFVMVPPSPGYTIVSGSFKELAEDISKDGLGI